MQAAKLEDTIVSLLRLAVTDLPNDVTVGLEQALKQENNSTAQNQLKTIFGNVVVFECSHSSISYTEISTKKQSFEQRS